MPELNEAQQIAYYSSHHLEAEEIHMLTGVGVGKTYWLAVDLIPDLSVPNSKHLICSPTFAMMKTATFKKVQEAWEEWGLREGVDYVVNKRMSGVKPYSGISSDKVITFRWGSYVVLTHLDNYNVVNGSEWDTISIDETRDVRNFQEALDKCRARTRGTTFKKLGLRHRIKTATTPPDNVAYYRELESQAKTSNGRIKLIRAESYANQHNLRPGYIEQLERTLDPNSFKREVLGMLVTKQETVWAYCFEHKKHVADIQERPDLPIFVSMDFNVSPMTCIYAQHDPSRNRIRILGEERIMNSDVYELCERIRTRYPDTARLILTGDASGRNRSATMKGVTNWKAVKGALKLSDAQIRLLSSNPDSKDTIVLINSMLSKHPDLLINRACKYLVEDCEMMQRGDDGKKIAPTNMHGHLFDCFIYYLWTFHRSFLDRFAKSGNFASV